LGVAFRLGTEMTVATGLGAVIGYSIDYYFGTKPWGIAVGVVLGGAAGMLNVYWAAQAMTKEIEKSDQEKNND
jgi:F0F1-type ATP synthase assembly protein I